MIVYEKGSDIIVDSNPNHNIPEKCLECPFFSTKVAMVGTDSMTYTKERAPDYDRFLCGLLGKGWQRCDIEKFDATNPETSCRKDCPIKRDKKTIEIAAKLCRAVENSDK